MKYLISLLIALTMLTNALSDALNPSISEELGAQAKLIASCLTLEQKIGQLFMIAAHCSESEPQTRSAHKLPYQMNKQYIEHAITRHHLGGIVFLGKGTKASIASSIKQFQRLSNLPLLIGLDAEWGSGMRLTDGLTFAKNNVLGIRDSYTTTFAIGYCIGAELKELGVHINFAPVVDVHTNPDNPIINNRSFSNDPAIVIKHAHAYIHGLRCAGILSCIKHFPGHGDTSNDSHYELPVVNHSLSRLEQIELAPFKQLCHYSDAVMIGHIAVPALDNSKTPASLSSKIITEVLQTRMNYNGLIITDGLGMQAVTQQYQPGELELAACLAGNDILLCPIDIEAAINHIKKAAIDGTLSIEELDNKVTKIITTKLRMIQ